jgi:glycosyltransferase involved in cell wall biosynthesis
MQPHGQIQSTKNNMNKPYVSCIMPTANRPHFVPLAVDYFLNQDYRNAELVIVDDGKNSIQSILPDHHRISYFRIEPSKTIGFKRNYACEKAKGEIIVHWDDDDWYAQDWISRQVQAIKEHPEADICGLNQIIFFSPLLNKYWIHEGDKEERPYLSGATMAYKKSFWKEHPFKDVQIGEDYDYVWNTGANIFAHGYKNGFLSILHAKNTTLKSFEDPRHKKHAIRWMDIPFNDKN